MRKKISIGLLLMIAFSLLGTYLFSLSQFIGIMFIIGAAAVMFMYIVACSEPDEMDDYVEEE
jgi:hypothetical protein